MASSDHLDDIVNDCLERMARGEGIEACLASYPEDRGQLLPLLQVAATTLEAASAISPDAMARQRGLQRLNEAVAQRGARKSGLRLPRFIWQSPVSRPVLAGALVLLVATGMALGADVAASDSVPGDTLYWVKTSKENLMLMLPKSDMSKAKDHTRFAQERGDEVGRLMDRGKFVEAEEHWGQVNRNLSQSAQLIGVRLSTNTTEMPSRGMNPANRADVDALTAALEQTWAASHAALSVHLVSASPKDRIMILSLMQRNKLIHRTLIAFLESGDSPNWPPFYRTEPPGGLSR
jgi:hypothetical protein